MLQLRRGNQHFVLVPTLLFNMTSPRELELMAQNSGDTDLSGLIAALKQDRISMIRMDGVRTLFLLVLQLR